MRRGDIRTRRGGGGGGAGGGDGVAGVARAGFTCMRADEGEEDHDAVSEDPDSEGAEAVELSKIAEMRLVPSDPSQLDTLFDIFCQCAELNPEPNEDGEEENTWFFGDKDMAVDGIGNDSEWQFLENLANPIGYANGDHDLAQTILEVNFLRFCYDTCKLQKLSFEVYS
ncbi:uncharacterized protein A4U43_C06F540 [Asparagus officinalis]|uniref:Uncharacterized protein n=1 Tax=Asparagus officinalis TaxID=4686 RepID=A0A5P1ENY8_ASPOF|nr:uncharacterized protein A4U43_C06F540 [Asparagus officinalis]